MHGGKTRKGAERREAQRAQSEKYLDGNNVIHGLYAKESNFVKSLTEEELEYMQFMREQIHAQYDIQGALEETAVEGMIVDAVMHFRLINSGRLERGSRHARNPLQDMMKTAKELGFTKKQNDSGNVFVSVTDKYSAMLDAIEVDKDEDNSSVH